MGRIAATRVSPGVVGAEDERREPESPVGRLELRGVEPGRPVARLHRDRARARALPAPVDRHRVAHREPGELVASQVRVRAVPDAEERQRERALASACTRSAIGSSGRYERRANDASTPSTRTTGAAARSGAAGSPSTVDAPLAVVADGEAHHVRADRRLRSGPPDELAAAPARGSTSSSSAPRSARCPSGPRRVARACAARGRRAPSRGRGPRPLARR